MNVVKRHPYRRLDDRAAAALLFGSVGLFLFNVVFGPIAIVLGARAARGDIERGASLGRLGRAAALLGIGLGIADLVVLVVLVAGKVHNGVLDWNVG
ncbi:hypothetical protein [Planosporangium mesophilum]|uniref:DUF4190 domain-containing protein n=1 Tax=Planosporangium mesophilum TaxID=689768 RepID=A0A8J3TFC8_9ACTN|nr:hypothetical protein [Planosporangium mesophilum]NJC85037.1 hypothetical protein [Planosporangium mesophilum]GII24511.1 hypothetical protein Pme01_41080 [Planosporangium mesophilum]